MAAWVVLNCKPPDFDAMPKTRRANNLDQPHHTSFAWPPLDMIILRSSELTAGIFANAFAKMMAKMIKPNETAPKVA
jgi:hypothetical protein